MPQRMLPEWAPHERVWIGFPSDPDAWGAPLAEAQRQIATFANAVHDGGNGETVHLIAKGGKVAERARDLCDAGVIVEDRLIGDVWLRDTGCIIVGNGPSRTARNFGFNGWGNRFDYEGDQTIGRELAEAALAHVAGDETERAYRRGDALERRRKLMQAWGTFCEPDLHRTVIPMVRPVKA